MLRSKGLKHYLERLQLIRYTTIELEIDKGAFVSKLRKNVDDRKIGAFSDSFDVFTSSKNLYKGQVDEKQFRIARRRKLFDMNMKLAIANGTYEQKGEKLIINTEINGFRKSMIPFYIFITIFYILFISAFVFTWSNDGRIPSFFILFIVLHALLMYGMPYLMMKNSVKSMSQELEREFYYLTKKE